MLAMIDTGNSVPWYPVAIKNALFSSHKSHMYRIQLRITANTHFHNKHRKPAPEMGVLCFIMCSNYYGQLKD